MFTAVLCIPVCIVKTIEKKFHAFKNVFRQVCEFNSTTARVYYFLADSFSATPSTCFEDLDRNILINLILSLK